MMDRRGFLHRLLHVFGLSCIGGAVFCEIMVFTDMARQGFCLVHEPNPLILTVEVFCSFLALAYYAHLYIRTVRELKQ